MHGRRSPPAEDGVTQSVMIRVQDVDAHHRAAVAAGAQVTSESADYSYGDGSTACVTQLATCGISPSQWPTLRPRRGVA